MEINNKMEFKDKISGLGEVTGDNILPKEILISLSSRRDPWAAFKFLIPVGKE